MAVFGAIGILLVVGALVYVMSGSSETSAAVADPTQTQSPGEDREAPRTAPSSSESPRAGKTPGRPAPAIAAEDLQQAAERYQTAKQLVNDAERARTAGDTATYAAKLQTAFEELEQQRDTLRPYTDWLEEADLGGWEIPGDYVGLQRKLGVYDPIYQRVKKLKRMK